MKPIRRCSDDMIHLSLSDINNVLECKGLSFLCDVVLILEVEHIRSVDLRPRHPVDDECCIKVELLLRLAAAMYLFF